MNFIAGSQVLSDLGCRCRAIGSVLLSRQVSRRVGWPNGFGPAPRATPLRKAGGGADDSAAALQAP
jgi:hypothetical protein